ncbi:MAG: lipid II:glycine glycyltransferase FemX [Acidimicrobiia bacterium]
MSLLKSVVPSTAHAAPEPAIERRTVDPRTDPSWATIMTGARGSLFGSPPWIAAVADTYGFDVTADVLLRDGTPVAGLACVELDDMRGHRVVSLPFGDRLDPVVDDDDQWERLATPLLARERPVHLRILEARPPLRDARFRPTNELAWHATDLDRPESDLLAGLHRQVRQNLRAADRHGVTVRLGTGLEDVRTFHELHRATRKRKFRLLAQPLALFERIWERFEPLDQLVVGLATHDGTVIAGALYLIWNDVIYYKFGASVAEHLVVRPNELLAWESMRLGQELGCRTYDWGVTDLDQPGLLAYKQKYATEERRVVALLHTPPGYDASASAEAGRVLSQLTDLLTRRDVPDEVTTRAGELLYRFFC